MTRPAMSLPTSVPIPPAPTTQAVLPCTRRSDLDAYLDRLKALFVASGRDEAEGVLFRVVLGAASVATTLDRKAIEAAMGESWLARFLKFGKPSSPPCTRARARARVEAGNQ